MMFRKSLCLTLILFHILTFVVTPEGLAYIAQSANYKLRLGHTNEGGCPNNDASDRSSSGHKMLSDSLGEPIDGVFVSPQYTLNAGFISIAQANPAIFSGPIPDQTWKTSQSLPDAFDLDDYFSSEEGLNLTYSAKNLSTDKKITTTIDDNTHIVSFSHQAGFIGTERVEFSATDEEFQVTKSNYVNLSVVAIHAPVLTIDSVTSPVDENNKVTIKTHAEDEDAGDEITFKFTPNSTKVELTQKIIGTDPPTVEATWQTDYDDSGSYEVTVRATDSDGLFNEKKVSITVNNVNRPPLITKVNGITVTQGSPVQLPDKNETDLITITPQAQDDDNDAVTFSYKNLGNADFDSEGKWSTDYDDAGDYEVEVKAFDGSDYSQPVIVKVTILNVNRAPEATLTLSDYTIYKNGTITITLKAEDPDGDDMTFSLKLDGQQIASGTLKDKETYAQDRQFTQAGDYTIEATLTDTGGLSHTKSVLLDCDDPNLDRNYINPIMGDFNGDSKSDLGLHNSHSDQGSWEICLSEDGEFKAAREWLKGFGTSRDWLPLGGDFNGDGLTDIGIYNNTSGTDGGKVKIALSTGSSFSKDDTPWATFQGSSYDWVPLTGNFNSDRYTDLAVYNSKSGEWKVALCNGSSFGSFTPWLDNFGGEGYSPLTGDFNADGIIDIGVFKKSSGEVKVAFGNTEKFIDSGTTWISGFATNKDLLIDDFNSDGSTDIGYWEKSSGTWTIATSNGTRFIQRQDPWLSFGSSSDESAHTGDFNGDGITDAATFDKEQAGIERWKVKLSTDVRSDLLTEIDNATGAKTIIAYDYAAKQENDLLPFSVYVARTITVTDYLPADQTPESYTQTFAYRGGYYDASEREFRGFERITITEPNTGNYAQTYFYQGKSGQDGALKGKVDKVLAYDKDTRLISEVNNTWEVRKSGPQDGPLGFPHITKTTQTAYEENDTSLTAEDRLSYDNLGNVTETVSLGDVLTPADDRTTNISYALPYQDGFNRPLETALKDQDDNLVTKKTFKYDQRGNLIKETAWLNTSEEDPYAEYTYDSFGNLTSTTDALGNIVITDYETTFYAFPEKVTNSLGHTVEYTYDPKFGVVTSTKDPNGNTSAATYDTFGRPIEQKNAYNEIVASYSYPDFNSRVTTQLNFTTKEYTDGLGRKYKTVSSGEDGDSPKEVISEIFYDERGFVSAESLPHYIDEPSSKISYVRYEYDTRGRLKKTKGDFPGEGDDAESTITYISPLEVEATDAKGHRKGTIKDIFGNTREIIEHTTGGVYHTHYQYDAQNNLVKLTDSQGNITSIQYDSLGRKLSMDDPDMGTWSYEYDLVGNLTRQTDAKNQVIEFEYDKLNRLVKKRLRGVSGGDPAEVEYIYDDPAKSDRIGRLSKVIDPSGSTEFFYDKLGREIKTIKSLRAEDDEAISYTVQRTYDRLDRLTSVTYPDGEVLNYTYDTNSGLIERIYSVDSELSIVDYVRDVTYNAKGQMVTVKYGNNTQTDYTYGTDLRLAKIFTQNSSSTTLQDLNYRFDKNGNITRITDNLAPDVGKIRNFSYDDLDRLTEAENLPDPNGGYTDFSYEYDSIGNMTKKGPVYNLTYMRYGEGSAGPHAVTTAGGNSYFYDANGNMTSGAGKAFEYEAENRLTNVADVLGTTTFLYDGDGGRVVKTTPTATTTYIGSLYEVTTSGVQTSVCKHIFLGSNRICSITDLLGDDLEGDSPEVGVVYYHSDHLGSSNILTDKDGNLAQHLEYTPYGLTALNEGPDPNATNYKFTGKELDSTTGLYYYGARYYDPQLGRFITPDTIVPSPFNPQSFNRYSYCYNNPLNYIDPTGHFSLKKWIGKIVGAVVGAITFGMTGNLGLAMAAYGFVSGTIDTYNAGYSVGQAIGIGILSGTAGYIGAGIGGAFGSWVGGGVNTSAGALGSAIFGGMAAGAAGSATHAALTGGNVGEAAWQGGAIGGAMGLFSYGLTYRGPPKPSNKEVTKEAKMRDLGKLQNKIDTARVKGLAPDAIADIQANNRSRDWWWMDPHSSPASNAPNTVVPGHRPLPVPDTPFPGSPLDVSITPGKTWGNLAPSVKDFYGSTKTYNPYWPVRLGPGSEIRTGGGGGGGRNVITLYP